MHQSKKDLLSKQWNQMLSMDFHNKLEIEQLNESGLITKEKGITMLSNKLFRR